MLLQMAALHSFLWPSNIPLYICTTSSLLIYSSMNTWVASMGLHLSSWGKWMTQHFPVLTICHLLHCDYIAKKGFSHFTLLRIESNKCFCESTVRNLSRKHKTGASGHMDTSEQAWGASFAVSQDGYSKQGVYYKKLLQQASALPQQFFLSCRKIFAFEVLCSFAAWIFSGNKE